MTRCEEIDSGRDGLVGMSDVVQKETRTKSASMPADVRSTNVLMSSRSFEKGTKANMRTGGIRHNIHELTMFVSIAESLMFLTQDRVAYMYSGARDRHVVMMGDQVKPVD